MLVRAGSTLVVPRHEQRQADVSGQVADNATMTLAPDRPAARRVAVKVGRKGDTVRAVARRHRVSASDVALWNGTHAGARFRAGETVVLYLVRKATATKPRGVAAPKVVARKKAPIRAARPVATASARARVTGN
jgi:membrane-bound lytic murein transglycosylase D